MSNLHTIIHRAFGCTDAESNTAQGNLFQAESATVYKSYQEADKLYG